MFMSFPVALPAKAEQQEIVEWIERAEVRFQALIKNAEVSIALLKERRTALISAAVTGQIDVRGLHQSAEPVPA